MDRRTSRAFAALFAAVVLAVAATVFLAGRPNPDPAPSDGFRAVGVVVGVQSEGLDKVHGFTLRLDDGSLVEFDVGVLENGNIFPPSHLVEHLADSQPLRVFYREDDGRRVAYRLEDGE